MTAGHISDRIADMLVQLAGCVALVGKETFTEPFLESFHALGARQVMIFAYDRQSARCLLARNFSARAMGRKLAEDYLEGWFESDPLYRQIMDLDDGACSVVHVSGQDPGMATDYGDRFFHTPGLSGKSSVLAARGEMRLILNIYAGEQPTPELRGNEYANAALVLAGRLAIDHFLRFETPDWPLPLAGLSSRERLVCLGVLAGKKSEIIAWEMGIAPSSAVTYRKRAYQKLGISGRAGLFALCRK